MIFAKYTKFTYVLDVNLSSWIHKYRSKITRNQSGKFYCSDVTKNRCYDIIMSKV